MILTMAEQSVLDLILKRLDKIDEHNEKILTQTTKTNGSVQHLKYAVFGDGGEDSGLIKRMNKQEHWKSRVKGIGIAFAIIWTIVSTILGIYVAMN